MLMNHTLRSSRLTVATAVLAGLSTFALHAQPVDSDDDTTTPATNMFAVSSNPMLNLAATSGVNYSSSTASTSVTVDPDSVDHLSFSDATQPPPRRRYGRPRYNDSSHNSDGSNKYEFELGGGFTAPLGNTYHYLNTNYAFQFGGGRDFNKKFGVLAQFDYDRFGFNGRTLGNQQNLYNFYCTLQQQNLGLCTQFTSLDGSSHVWSFTLDPHYNFAVSEGVGAYVVGGVGFFHKTANFTTPAQGVGYDPYYGYYEYTANETVDKYTANAPGFDGGFGLTYKPSRFGGERFFAEGRYVFIPNSQRHGVTVNNTPGTLNAYNGSDFYPANSNRTTYTVFKAGLRF